MADLEWAVPRPVRWLLDRAWSWLAGKVLPEGDAALFDLGNVFEDEEVAA